MTDFTKWERIQDSELGETHLNSSGLVQILAADFDKTLNDINAALFPVDTYFQSIYLASAAGDTAQIEIEEVVNGTLTVETYTMRVGSYLSVLGNQILSAGTDATAVIVVGVR